MGYRLQLEDTLIEVEITGKAGRVRPGSGTEYRLDGETVGQTIPRPHGGTHRLSICL